MGKAIGIDLGTTYSCVAECTGEKVTVIPTKTGARTTPSVVLYNVQDGVESVLVGQDARSQRLKNTSGFVSGSKRCIGKSYAESKANESKINFKILDNNGKTAIEVNGKPKSPVEVAVAILKHLKKMAEDYLGSPVNEAVITVPAYFNDSQREDTKTAGEIAGFKVLRIINEPTAAALAYGLEKKSEGKDVGKILVFDLGGGTFDVSLVDIMDGIIEVKAVAGDAFLGGEDFTHLIFNLLAQELKSKYKIDAENDLTMKHRLLEASENAKIELSTNMLANIYLPFLGVDSSGQTINFEFALTRTKYNSLIQSSPMEKKILACLEEVCKSAGENISSIQKILLVGGATRMPYIRELLSKMSRANILCDVNPDEAVAIGAGLLAATLSSDVTQKSESSSVLLLDVTPLNIGIETLGGVSTVMIEKNTTIPAKKSQIFSTAADNQTAVTIVVVQGNRPMAADNKQLGTFILDGISPAPRGTPQIEVSFDIDANGILNVSAKDMATNKEQKITIQSGGGLSKEEIEKMKRDAQQHEEADKAKIALVEVRNMADTTLNEGQKILKDNEGKDISNLEAAVKELKDLYLVSENIEEIRAQISNVQSAMSKVLEQAQAATEETKTEN